MSFCDHMKDLRHFCLDSLIMVHGVLSCFSSLGNVLPLSLNAYIRFCGLCLLCLMRIVYIVFRPGLTVSFFVILCVCGLSRLCKRWRFLLL